MSPSCTTTLQPGQQSDKTLSRKERKGKKRGKGKERKGKEKEQKGWSFIQLTRFLRETPGNQDRGALDPETRGENAFFLDTSAGDPFMM